MYFTLFPKVSPIPETQFAQQWKNRSPILYRKGHSFCDNINLSLMDIAEILEYTCISAILYVNFIRETGGFYEATQPAANFRRQMFHQERISSL